MSYKTRFTAQAQDSSRFVWDVLSTLPPSLQHAGAQAVQFCSDYVKHDETKGVKSFDFPGFKNAVDNLPDVDFIIEGFDSANVSPGPIVQLPATFATPLVQKFRLPIEEKDVADFIQVVYDRLDYAKQAGVADFYVIPSDTTKKPATKAQSVWEYRLLIMTANPNVPTDFHVQPAVLEVKAETDNESDWAPPKDGLKATSARVTLMKIAATKDFRRPEPPS
ncbi:unnamed protein product [Rhizoctonia solani]|uniref:Uncharacterized protein n=1 Tax=Rhizoctonia solani TaxID=456999 RepID=A0A8H3E3W9_9AGAM|nr:unnamed protein product [Rhizoctonia solani]